MQCVTTLRAPEVSFDSATIGGSEGRGIGSENTQETWKARVGGCALLGRQRLSSVIGQKIVDSHDRRLRPRFKACVDPSAIRN
jgi:hypothetical protein